MFLENIENPKNDERLPTLLLIPSFITETGTEIEAEISKKVEDYFQTSNECASYLKEILNTGIPFESDDVILEINECLDIIRGARSFGGIFKDRDLARFRYLEEDQYTEYLTGRRARGLRELHELVAMPSFTYDHRSNGWSKGIEVFKNSIGNIGGDEVLRRFASINPINLRRLRHLDEDQQYDERIDEYFSSATDFMKLFSSIDLSIEVARLSADEFRDCMDAKGFQLSSQLLEASVDFARKHESFVRGIDEVAEVLNISNVALSIQSGEFDRRLSEYRAYIEPRIGDFTTVSLSSTTEHSEKVWAALSFSIEELRISGTIMQSVTSQDFAASQVAVSTSVLSVIMSAFGSQFATSLSTFVTLATAASAAAGAVGLRKGAYILLMRAFHKTRRENFVSVMETNKGVELRTESDVVLLSAKEAEALSIMLRDVARQEIQN